MGIEELRAITGLGAEQARALLDAVGGDLDAAVQLYFYHFDEEDAGDISAALAAVTKQPKKAGGRARREEAKLAQASALNANLRESARRFNAAETLTAGNPRLREVNGGCATSHPTEPPVGVAANANSSDAEEQEYICPYTQKRFKSKATYDTHIKSKKYAQLAANSAPPTRAKFRTRDEMVSTLQKIAGIGADRARFVLESSNWDLGALVSDPIVALRGGGAQHSSSTTGASTSSAANGKARTAGETRRGGALAAEGAHGSDSGEETGADSAAQEGDDDASWIDVDELPWEARWNECLFDGHRSASLDENFEYMRTTFGFALPFDAAFLLDAQGLFAYLQEKVCKYHTCLYCNKYFRTLKACHSHMLHKAHCKLNFKDDEGAAELSAFYDVEAYIAARAVPVGDADDCRDSAELHQLVLPNGSRLGHRSLRKYYKQTVRNDYISAPAGPNGRKQLSYCADIGSQLALREKRKTYADLGQKLALRAERKREWGVLVRAGAYALGNSKAISSQFVFKQAAAHNERFAAIRHHWGAGGGGSHYHMAGSKQWNKGVRIKGTSLRHSKQAVRKGFSARVKQARAKKGD
jgi:hypothetical protein